MPIKKEKIKMPIPLDVNPWTYLDDPSYKVKRGDSFWKIAKEKLWGGATSRQIADAVNLIRNENKNIKGDLLREGQSVKLPSPNIREALAQYYIRAGRH